jgi:RNA polymerase sigma-70 factor (ECF subfamily)
MAGRKTVRGRDVDGSRQLDEAAGEHTRRAIDAVWRLEEPKIIAGLTRLVRDLSTAEDLAHDALVAALQQWPVEGIPLNPGAWLMAAAKHRAIDLFRRQALVSRKHEALAREADATTDDTAALDAALDDDIGDNLLRLIFVACHPVLPTEGRVALTLRLVGGLTTDEIARAFVVPEPTIAQRIVRAKRTLAKARVPFEVPHGPDRFARLASVLDVIYLVFNEGYSATAGDDWVRPALCDEALRLGRVVAALAPQEGEVHGLLALMELQSSRLRARIGPKGEAVRLLDQDRTRWDQLLIARGLTALSKAEALAGDAWGSYTLEAAIAACHARARLAEDTDWRRIATLYAALADLTASPVVRLNHAVAVGMAEGPAMGLALVDALLAEGALRSYHYAPSVRGDLLEKLGRYAEARTEFERAAVLARNAREQELLLARACACAERRV